MSSIKDLLQEERDAEALVKEAERKAEALVQEAKRKAADAIRKAQSDEVQVNELSLASKERSARLRKRIAEECDQRAAETEQSCNANLRVTTKLIVDTVLGVDYEW